MSRIIIIGGHGKVARLLTAKLVATNDSVTAIIRNPAHAVDVQADGAHPEVFDIEHASLEQIVGVLKEHDAVVWSAGAGGGSPNRTYAVDRDAAIQTMDAAARAQVKRFVMVSYARSGLEENLDPGDGFYAYAQAKAEADAYLRKSALDWTIVGPGRLTSEPASGLIATAPDGRAEDNATSRANVALVIAYVLTNQLTIGKTIRFVDGEIPVDELLAA